MVWEIVSIAATFVALRSRSMKSECWVMAFAREGTSIPSEPTTPMRDALVRLHPPLGFCDTFRGNNDYAPVFFVFLLPLLQVFYDVLNIHFC